MNIATQYEVSLSSLGINISPYDIIEALDTSILQKIYNSLSHTIKRGDIVHIYEFGDYRDTGLLICNGETLECLDIWNDYYIVSSKYCIGDEFVSTHWKNTSLFITTIHINIEKYKDEILKNIHVKNDQARTFFDASLGRFHIIFNPHIDSVYSSVEVSNIFKQQLLDNVNVDFDWCGVDTLYEENTNPYTLYYVYE